MAIRDHAEDAWGDPSQEAERLTRPLITEAHLRGLNVGLPEAGLDPQVSPDPRSLRFARRNNARAVQRVGQDMRDEIVDGVQTALRDGRRQEAVEQAIADSFDGEAWRVPVIGRTELNRAHNWARMSAWRKSNVVRAKEWLTAGDERVRTSHANIHGERVPKGRAFSIGVQAPPAGPNCRCTLTPVTSISGFQPEHTGTGRIFGLAQLEREYNRRVLGVFEDAADRVTRRLRERGLLNAQPRRRVVA